ncbi:MAG TPA: PIN domain-containing protein [Pirellulales bacterium]|nr:PIN domain-containing protein [Pirellulales bacterium]
MIFLDTSYLLALVDPRDELHERALAWADVLNDRLLTTEQVLLECVNAFSAPIERPRANTIVGYLRTSRSVEFTSSSAELLDAGLQLHQNRPDKSWSLTDCISFIVMQQRGVNRALSSDPHVEQAGFEALLRRSPP